MALLHGIRCFAHHQVYTRRMGHDTWQSAPRFVLNWLLLMAVQCLLEVHARHARMRAQRAATGEAQEALPSGSSKASSAGSPGQRSADAAADPTGEPKCAEQSSTLAVQASAATAPRGSQSAAPADAPRNARSITPAQRGSGRRAPGHVQLTPAQVAAARAIVHNTRGQGYVSLRYTRMSKVSARPWHAYVHRHNHTT